MRRLLVAGFLVVLTSVLLTQSGEAAGPPSLDPTKREIPFILTTPKTLADLHRLEERVQYVMKKAMPATVGMGGGSAVIINKEGILLTVAHVGSKAGRNVVLLFPDGKRAKGRTLGNYAGIDAGMAKITDKGPWPYAEMGKSDDVKVGQWCVAMGYPVSFSKGQKPPVRVGRVLRVTATTVVTDCVLMGGDSGGPLFDMNGRVIGQNSRTAGGVTGNVHVPVDVYHKNWKDMMDGKDWSAPGGRGRAGSDDEDEEWLAAPPTLGLKKTPIVAPTPRRIRTGPNERNHEAIRNAFREATQPSVKAIVRVLADGQPVALGTVVHREGLIVTKATVLKGKLTCKLHDGTVHDAVNLGEDKENDLAVLRIDAKDLTPVRWRTADVVPQGNLVAAVGEAGEALAVGTVTSEPRKFGITERPATKASVRPYLGVGAEPNKDKGLRLIRVTAGEAAAKAGLKEGDVILKIADKDIKTLEELRAVIAKCKTGDRLPLLVERGKAQEEIAPVLGKLETAASPPAYDRWGGGPFSEKRRFGYGKVLPHDTYINPRDMGGPLVDTRGQVVGVNISRALRISTYALLPADVERLVAKITAKSGK